MIRYQYKKKLMQKNVYKLFQQKNSKPKPCIIAVCKSSVILNKPQKKSRRGKSHHQNDLFFSPQKIKVYPPI